MFFHLYGFFIALGILVGSWIAEQFRKKQLTIRQLADQQLAVPIYDLLPWVLIPGIIGARLYHVLDWWEYYSQSPLEMIMVWQGGLGIFGGILGGIIGLWFYSFFSEVGYEFLFIFKSHAKKFLFIHKLWRRDAVRQLADIKISQKLYPPRKKLLLKKINIKFLMLLDLAAIGLPVGQVIGRLGNYFNQELYGLPTNLPWGIYISPENRLPGYENFSKFHPLFAYEGLWCLVIFILLIFITHYPLPITRKKRGTLFFLYLFLYSFGRFWLEFLRIGDWLVSLPFVTSLVKVNQLVALGLMIISGWFWISKEILFSEQER